VLVKNVRRLLVCIGELQPPDIVLVKAVPLQRINHQRRLKVALEVGKAQNDLLVGVDLPRNQPDRLEPLERPEDVRDFALRCINWDPFDVNCVRGVLRHAKYVLAKHGLNVLSDSLLERLMLLL